MDSIPAPWGYIFWPFFWAAIIVIVYMLWRTCPYRRH